MWAMGALAAIPHMINYQGRLTNSSGVPLTGAYDVTFRIYDAQTAGNLLWQETHAGVVVDKGIFSAVLGSVSALNIAFDKSYFLEIKVGDEVMSPRQQITSAGYAIRAEMAQDTEKFGTKAPAEYLLASDATSVPTANKAVKMDTNGKLPLSALKTFDSGWFAVSLNKAYLKTHNLGTTKCVIVGYLAENSDGSGKFAWGFGQNQQYGGGVFIAELTSTTVTIRTDPSHLGSVRDKTGNAWNPTSGYVRVIMLALE
jgi:hypothetical protein